MSTTVQLRVAPTGSTFPASSIAWTTSVCGPGVVTSISSGVSQLPRSTPSSVHWKSSSSAGVKSSVPENSKMLMKFGVDEPSGGPLVIVVAGGVVSGPMISHSKIAGVRSIQPRSLIAWTMNSWSPSPSGPTVNGDSQKKNGSPSIEHCVIAFGWSAQNSKVAKPLVEVGRPSGPSGPSGPERIEVSGIIPEEAAAIAKSEKLSASPQTLRRRRRTGCSGS